jgi:hypothetical protein
MSGYLEWQGLPRDQMLATMTLGQMTEIAMLAVLPRSQLRIRAKATRYLGRGRRDA